MRQLTGVFVTLMTPAYSFQQISIHYSNRNLHEVELLQIALKLSLMTRDYLKQQQNKNKDANVIAL